MATGSTASQLTFMEHAGKNGHTPCRHFELALPGNKTTEAVLGDSQAAIYANAYTSPPGTTNFLLE